MSASDALMEKLWNGEAVTEEQWLTARRAEAPAASEAGLLKELARHRRAATAEIAARADLAAYLDDLGAFDADLAVREALAAHIETRTALEAAVATYSAAQHALAQRHARLWAPVRNEQADATPPRRIDLSTALHLAHSARTVADLPSQWRTQ